MFRFTDGIRAGETSISIPILLRNTSDSVETTGVTSGSVSASYWRQGSTPTAISVSGLSNLDDPWSSGGWFQANATTHPGLYRFDIPNAAFAFGSDWVIVSVVVAGSFVFHQMFALTHDGLIRSALAQAGTATTITLDASASASNDFYTGDFIFIVDGTGALQPGNKIIGYNGTTKVATVKNAFIVTPNGTSRFVIIADYAINDVSIADLTGLDVNVTEITGNASAATSLAANISNLDIGVSSRSQPGDAMTLTSTERNATADAFLARNVAGGSSSGRTVSQALAFLRNRWAISGTTLTVYGTDDATPLWTATITRVTGDPVSSVDPA